MANQWTTDGKRITDAGVLEKLRRSVLEESALIIEHRFFQGARAPHRLVTDDPDALEDYLRKNARPGDSFHVWRFEECCRDDNVFESGKIPDPEGKTPVGGAY